MPSPRRGPQHGSATPVRSRSSTWGKLLDPQIPTGRDSGTHSLLVAVMSAQVPEGGRSYGLRWPGQVFSCLCLVPSGVESGPRGAWGRGSVSGEVPRTPRGT